MERSGVCVLVRSFLSSYVALLRVPSHINVYQMLLSSLQFRLACFICIISLHFYTATEFRVPLETMTMQHRHSNKVPALTVT